MFENPLSLALLWNSDRDALVEHRPRIGAIVSALGSIVLLPFIIAHALEGRAGLVVTFTMVALLLIINAYGAAFRERPFVPFAPVVAVLTFAVSVSIMVQGQNGVLWAYPVLFIGFFVLSRRWANALGLALLAAVWVATWQSVGPSFASRAAATLLLNFVMINLVLNVLDHLHHTLIQQAILDPLTGSFNRRHFQSRITAVINQADFASEVLVVFDIDHFKRVNDTYGHDVGDEVLKGIVDIARSLLRQGDEIFRLGGEEFAILLSDIDPESARAVVEAIRNRAENSRLLPSIQSAVTVSIGMARRERGMAADQWYRHADTALYAAKRDGRNRVVEHTNLVAGITCCGRAQTT